MGKLIELELADSAEPNGEAELKAMCEKLLANPIVEDFAFDLEKAR